MRIASLLLLFALAACSPGTPLDAGTTGDTPSAADVGSGDAAFDGGLDPCAGGACGPCDAALALDDDDARNAARALGVCSGLVTAAWVLPDGAPPPSSPSFSLGHGLLDGFGAVVDPREGARLLALSSGAARDSGDAGYATNVDRGYSHAHPSGFPFEAPACPGVLPGTAHDGIALALSLEVPPGANGFRVLVKHHTNDWPAFVCGAGNDLSAVFVSPPPPGAHPSGDVALDAEGNPLSVNASSIDVCACAGGPPCTAGARTFACSAGSGELAGTGFDEAAATPWLELRVPATAGESIEVLLAVWDVNDGILDSTTLYDGFRWITDAPTTVEFAVAR